MAMPGPRVDACTARAAPFAQPVLTYLRKCMHGAGADVQEDIKWGMPLCMHETKPWHWQHMGRT